MCKAVMPKYLRTPCICLGPHTRDIFNKQQKCPDRTCELKLQWKQKEKKAIRVPLNQIPFALKRSSSGAVLPGCEQEKGNHQEASCRVELKIEN